MITTSMITTSPLITLLNGLVLPSLALLIVTLVLFYRSP